MDENQDPKEFINAYLGDKQEALVEGLSGLSEMLTAKERKFEMEGERAMNGVYSKLDPIWKNMEEFQGGMDLLEEVTEEKKREANAENVDISLMESMTGISVIRKRIANTLFILESKNP